MRTKDVVGWRTEMRIWSRVRSLDDSHSIQAADVEECSSRNGQEHAPAGCCHRAVPWKKNQGSRGWSTRETEQPIGGEGLSVLLHSFFSAKARSAAFCGLPDQYSQRRKDREKCQGEPIASSAGPTGVSTVHFCVCMQAHGLWHITDTTLWGKDFQVSLLGPSIVWLVALAHAENSKNRLKNSKKRGFRTSRGFETSQ